MTCLTGLCIFENLIGDGALLLVGNPIFLGLMFLGLFGAIIFIIGGRLELKIMVGVPILVLSLLFIPQLLIPFVIAIAVLIFIALMRLITK